ncbi:MAG TPA: PDZ domain-containing protein [Planctomycetota bacterium]|nr:PDZ domain-containing protein [Planctomycetota bacterium]
MRRTAFVSSHMLVLTLILSGYLRGPVLGQEAGLGDELKKVAEEGRKGLAEEVSKAVAAREEKLLAEVLKIVEKRIAERVARLEAGLKERSEKILDLEAKLKALAERTPAQPAPAPAPAPQPASSGALLGVNFVEPPADLRGKLKVEGGILVTRVEEGSPAAAAGIKENDVIIDVNGIGVTSATILSVVGQFKPEQEVNVTFFHDGNKVTKAVKLADREKFIAAQAKKGETPAPKKEPVKLGVMLREEGGALVVEEVDEGLTGSVAGLKKDDRLTQLNGKDLKTLEDITGELHKVSSGDKFQLAYKRGDETVSLSLIGSAGKDGAKVLTKDSKVEKPRDDRKPGVLGVEVAIEATGIVIEAVVPDAAAAAGGVKPGDILKKVNGQDVSDVDKLKDAISKLKAGDKVTLVVSRGGKDEELKDIPLGAEGEKVAALERPKTPDPSKPQKGELGILATLTPEGSIVVKTVKPGGGAEKAELQVGDTILRVNEREIRSFDDLASALQPLHAGDSIVLRVKRGAEEREVKVTLGAG